MSKACPHRELTFGGPAIYRIRIQGFLEASWSERLGGMTLSVSRHADHGMVTTLVGRLLDQAALAGVLTALYNLELPLLSVEYVEDQTP